MNKIMELIIEVLLKKGMKGVTTNLDMDFETPNGIKVKVKADKLEVFAIKEDK